MRRYSGHLPFRVWFLKTWVLLFSSSGVPQVLNVHVRILNLRPPAHARSLTPPPQPEALSSHIFFNLRPFQGLSLPGARRRFPVGSEAARLEHFHWET